MNKLSLALMAALLATPAAASDYGCKVLLCLSNPGGPREFVECHPPIDQLYEDLKKGRPFPTCDEAGNNYARRVHDPFDPCPEGTKAATRSSHVTTGQKQSNGRLSTHQRAAVSEAPGGPRACVGKPVGSYVTSDCNDCVSYTVSVFESIDWQTPQNPRAIDVFLDGAWSRRIRY